MRPWKYRRDLTVIRLQTDRDIPDLVLASAYLPGDDENCPPGDHKEMTDLVLIICTDSNAHHPLWGSEVSNTRGKTNITRTRTEGTKDYLPEANHKPEENGY